MSYIIKMIKFAAVCVGNIRAFFKSPENFSGLKSSKNLIGMER